MDIFQRKNLIFTSLKVKNKILDRDIVTFLVFALLIVLKFKKS